MLFQPDYGAVAGCVGNSRGCLRREDGIASGGEVNHAFGGRRAEALPAIDLAHADLTRCEQSLEQYGRGFGRGQHGLGLDAALELFMQPLDGCSARRQKTESASAAGTGK